MIELVGADESLRKRVRQGKEVESQSGGDGQIGRRKQEVKAVEGAMER